MAFCYANTFEYYNSSCRAAFQNKSGYDSQWIVVNPFNKSATNDFIKDDNDTAYQDVQGLIIIADEGITAQDMFSRP